MQLYAGNFLFERGQADILYWLTRGKRDGRKILRAIENFKNSILRIFLLSGRL
jgi:hypothetical protein